MNRYDEYIWKVESYLRSRYGVDAADRMISPLTWYVGTGRASATFLINMVQEKPFVIGRILAKGGSYDDVVRKIRKRIGLPEVVW